jgi:hypothetical protein
MYIYLIFGAKIIEKLHQFNKSNFKHMYMLEKEPAYAHDEVKYLNIVL